MLVAGRTLYITKFTESSDSGLSRTIFIEDVPSDLVEFLELHLESRKKGGGHIEKLVQKSSGILVTFEDLQGLKIDIMSCHNL